MMRRRTLLVLGTSAGVAGVAGSQGFAAAACASTSPAAAVVSAGASGAAGSLREFVVQGSDATVQLVPGPAATVLLYAARRFHYEIDALHPGEVVAGSGSYAGSDSGRMTLDLRPAWYAPGVTGGLLPYQVTVVRDIIAECDGLLAWGGDAAQPREGRFTLTVAAGSSRLRAVARRLDGYESKRAQRVGAGMSLPYTEARKRRAEKIRKLAR